MKGESLGNLQSAPAKTCFGCVMRALIVPGTPAPQEVLGIGPALLALLRHTLSKTTWIIQWGLLCDTKPLHYDLQTTDTQMVG